MYQEFEYAGGRGVFDRTLNNSVASSESLLGKRVYDPSLGRWVSVDSIDIDPGDYYDKDGKYIGKDERDDNKTYVTTQKKFDENINKKDEEGNAKPDYDGLRKTSVDLNIKHTDFQECVSIIRQEGDSKDPDEYRILASIFYNHAKNNPLNLIKTLRQESCVYKIGNPQLRFSVTNNSIPVVSTRAGLIHRLYGGSDLSGGATQNDGNDFFAWGLTKGPFGGGKHAKFREYRKITISKDIFDKITTNLKNTHPSGKITYRRYKIFNIPILENVFLDKANFDKDGNFIYHTGAKSKRDLIATAAAGETIYWKYNYQ